MFDSFYDKEEPTYLPDRIPYFYVANAPARIDYIFTSSQTILNPVRKENVFIEKVTLANGKKNYLSDHIGLHCILKINNK
jgi:hypothetical protein